MHSLRCPYILPLKRGATLQVRPTNPVKRSSQAVFGPPSIHEAKASHGSNASMGTQVRGLTSPSPEDTVTRRSE